MNYVLLKLISGESVIGTMVPHQTEIVIAFPMAVSTFPLIDKNGKMCGGTIILKNWIEGSIDEESTIPRSFIVAQGTPDLELISEYEKVKKLEIKAKKEIKKQYSKKKAQTPTSTEVGDISEIVSGKSRKQPRKDNKVVPRKIGGKINLNLEELFGDTLEGELE